MSHSRADEQQGFFEINVTPLTDVFLVLLAIFLVTGAALAPGALEVDLPKASDTRAAVSPRAVTVMLDAHGRLSVDGRAEPEARLERAIRAALTLHGWHEVVLAGDRAATLEKAAFILDAARKAGAERTSLAVSPKP